MHLKLQSPVASSMHILNTLAAIEVLIQSIKPAKATLMLGSLSSPRFPLLGWLPSILQYKLELFI